MKSQRAYSFSFPVSELSRELCFALSTSRSGARGNCSILLNEIPQGINNFFNDSHMAYIRAVRVIMNIHTIFSQKLTRVSVIMISFCYEITARLMIVWCFLFFVFIVWLMLLI